ELSAYLGKKSPRRVNLLEAGSQKTSDVLVMPDSFFRYWKCSGTRDRPLGSLIFFSRQSGKKTVSYKKNCKLLVSGGCCLLLLGFVSVNPFAHHAQASWPFRLRQHAPICDGVHECGEWEGAWYWMRSPEQEQRVIASLYNRYCIRCHGVDGR